MLILLGLRCSGKSTIGPLLAARLSFPPAAFADLDHLTAARLAVPSAAHAINTLGQFDAIVANPPFSLRWDPTEAVGEDFRFKNYGIAPKSAADFAFLLHGFQYLKEEGTMAIILPHGVLFRGGAEARIRRKLIDEGNIDAVIGLAPNLFYSTGIPVCILILKKWTKIFLTFFPEWITKRVKRVNYFFQFFL